MLEIRIDNTIRMEGELDQISETYPVEVTHKGSSLYLRYRNSEDQQVVLKGTAREWVMTRFASPKSIMRFSLDGLTQSLFVTNHGQLPIYIQTQSLDYAENDQHVRISYSLYLDPDCQQELAHYDLAISWGNF